MSILEIQKALKAAGYDIGTSGPNHDGLDGIDGPKTHAALVKYQQDHGLSMAADQWDATVTALRGAGGAASASPADEWTQYQAKYPQFAWAFSDPEVANVLRTAMANKWGPDEVQGAVLQTNWWRSKTNGERDWLQTLATNPAEATRQLNNYDSITKYITLSNDYGLPVSFEAAARQVDRVVRGEVAPDALQEELRIQAKALYPQLAQQIDGGSTISDIYAPYQQMASDLLGVNPADIKLTDPKWQLPLQVTGKDGQKRLATTDEWQTILRANPVYGYDTSTNGRQTAAQLTTQLGKMFGAIA